MQWKIYLGGGAVDAEQTELLHGAVVLVKGWWWAALTILAAWILTCCCPSGNASWVDSELLFTETPTEPLEDDVEQESMPMPGKCPEPLELEQRARFIELCNKCWTGVSDHAAFRDWPMGPPGEPPDCTEEQRAARARECAVRIGWWGA